MKIIRILILGTIICCLAGLALLCYRTSRSLDVQVASNQLKTVRLAVSNYQSDDRMGQKRPLRMAPSNSDEEISWRFRVRQFMENGPEISMNQIHPGFSGKNGYATAFAVDYPNSPWQSEIIDFDRSSSIFLIFIPESRIPWAEAGDLIIDVEPICKKDFSINTLEKSYGRYLVASTDGSLEQLTVEDIRDRCRGR